MVMFSVALSDAEIELLKKLGAKHQVRGKATFDLNKSIVNVSYTLYDLIRNKHVDKSIPLAEFIEQNFLGDEE